MTKETMAKVDAFILDVLHDPARREVLLALLTAAGMPAASPDAESVNES